MNTLKEELLKVQLEIERNKLKALNNIEITSQTSNQIVEVQKVLVKSAIDTIKKKLAI